MCNAVHLGMSVPCPCLITDISFALFVLNYLPENKPRTESRNKSATYRPTTSQLYGARWMVHGSPLQDDSHTRVRATCEILGKCHINVCGSLRVFSVANSITPESFLHRWLVNVIFISPNTLERLCKINHVIDLAGLFLRCLWTALFLDTLTDSKHATRQARLVPAWGQVETFWSIIQSLIHAIYEDNWRREQCN